MSKKVNKDKVNDLVVKNESNYQIPKRILLQ